MAVSNGLIAISYGSIPFFIFVFVRKRRDLPFTWIFILFSLFILACGSTHFVHIIGLWHPAYGWQSIVDSLTALVSVVTAIALWPTLPRLLAIPSPAQLRAVNKELREEKDKLLAAQRELAKSYAEVEGRVAERTAELKAVNEALVVEVEERKLAEARVRELNEGLEARVAARTADLESFTYSVSHDLRAPLRAIDNFSRFLEEDHAETLDQEGKRLLGVVRRNTEKMDRLIADLLRLSRLSRQELHVTTIDMGGLVESVLAELSETSSLETFEVELRPLPPCRGDPALLRQVWINLISNAAKYSMKSDVRKIEIDSGAEADSIVYHVRDWGAGFDPAYSDKLFKVFQRLHKTEEFEGTGIGLAIVQQIVARHGGSVRAEGRPGEGARFSFSIPEAKGDER
ncbi:MAG: ATP-binding protein [Treponema sp.]|nr:ATP-binding protein [Treponema sp.]